jgi:hypothetical protein
LSITVGFRLSPEADVAMANQLKMAEVQAILALARGGGCALIFDTMMYRMTRNLIRRRRSQ